MCESYSALRFRLVLTPLHSHEVSWAVYGVTFESSDKVYFFHERGQKWSLEWRPEWDA